MARALCVGGLLKRFVVLREGDKWDVGGAQRRAIGLRIPIHLMPDASRRSITRMKRKDVTTSKLAAPPFAYPQPDGDRNEKI
jgi:hypothetical protein